VRAELRREILAKLASQLERLATNFGGTPVAKGWAKRGLGKVGVFKGLEIPLRRAPDKEFETMMANLDELDPERMSKGLRNLLVHLPKNRGGRPPTFSLDIRRRAVQDIGHEYPNRDSLSEAIEVVAGRYGMTPEYLRKVWKNRKRLRQRDT